MTNNIALARMQLAEYFDPTPIVRSEALSTPDHAVYLKNETVLPTGSFKVRGAIHALKTELTRGPLREVVAASTGNHGTAVAFAAKLLGVPARIFLPRDSNAVTGDDDPTVSVLMRGGSLLVLSSHGGDGEFGQAILVVTDNVDAFASSARQG